MAMGPNAVHIQAHENSNQQWIVTHYNMTDEELASIIEEWSLELRLMISDKDLSDLVNGPSLDVSKE